jgi:hypothetical protein
MAANTNPIFPKEGNSFGVLINAANTAADGSGTLFDLITATVDGTRVDGVIFTNSQVTVGAAAAKVCRMFITDAAGANPMLIGEVALAALTRSATAIGQRAVFFFEKALILKSGQKIKVSSSVRATSADDMAAVALAGNY